MKIKFEKVNAALTGASFAIGVSALDGGFGSMIAQGLTGFQGDLVKMGLLGGMVINTLVYGTATGLLGESFYITNWSMRGFVATSLSTYPVNFMGTLLGYAMVDSSQSIGQVALNGAISSSLYPIAVAVLLGGGYAVCSAYSVCKKHGAPEVEVPTSIPTTNRAILKSEIATEEEKDSEIIREQADKLEQGKLNTEFALEMPSPSGVSMPNKTSTLPSPSVSVKPESSASRFSFLSFFSRQSELSTNSPASILSPSV